MPADREALVARLRKEAHDLDAAYRAPEDGPSSTAQLLLDAAAALAVPPEAAPTSLVAGERPIVWIAMNGHGQIFAAYWDEAEAARNTQYVTGVRVSGVQPTAPAPDCRAAVRAALQEVRAAIRADQSGIYAEPSGIAALRILDAKLAALERQP